jgi:hypothetical protein
MTTKEEKKKHAAVKIIEQGLSLKGEGTRQTRSYCSVPRFDIQA